MPEGPSIVLVKEAIKFLTGKKVVEAGGSTDKVDFGRLHGAKLKSIKTWGKHLLLCFPDFTVRIHLMMFGTYAVNTPKANRIVKLGLEFTGGEAVFFYACSIATLDKPINKIYDWTADVMNKNWDTGNALKKLKAHPKVMITDALLDQKIFSGVGNIIKNEVLFRAKVHPESIVGKIPLLKRKAIIKECVTYSKEFLKWRRDNVLKKHWEAYTKKRCPRDKNSFTKAYLGKTRRRTFYCEVCQKYYS